MIFCLLYFLAFGLELTVHKCESKIENDTLKDLHLIGLFPTSGSWKGGQGLLPAALMAIDDINNRSDILPGYRLNLEYSNTQCDSGSGIKFFSDMVCQQPTKIMIIGAGCSTVSQAVAQAAHHWNLVQISYVSISAALSDKEKYPNFFRLVTSESQLNKARIALLKHFNWTRVSTLHEDYQIFSTMIEDLVDRLKEEDYEIHVQGMFTKDPEISVQRLKDNDARIIVAGFYPDKARKVFCTAYNMGFYGKQVWITTGAVSHDGEWWKVKDSSINCTKEQMDEVLNNTLIVHNVYTNINETETGLPRLSVQRFREVFEDRTRNVTKPIPGAERAPTGYDTVWAAAVSLNKTLNNLTESGSLKTLGNFSYDDSVMAELIKAKLHEINFTSVSGQVAFKQNGDGVRLIGIQLIRDSKQLMVGLYDLDKPDGKRLTIDVIWKEDVPTDVIQTKRVIISLPPLFYIIMTSLAGIGIILVLTFLSFNIAYRKVRVIQMSSPNINNIILVGCVLAYCSVFIADISVTSGPIYCKVKTSLLLIGFSLSFGALFAKTWRVYKIITAVQQWRMLTSPSVKDQSLCLMVVGLVCLNSIVLCTWFVVDPQITVTKDISGKIQIADDMKIVHAYNYCRSSREEYFLITILVTQGIFLLLGVFLAWETKKVPFSILNESRYIGMCIYNIVVLSVVGMLVSYSVKDNPAFVYVITSCIILLCTTVTQCLLFVPKVMAYRKYSKGNLQDRTLTTVTLDIVEEPTNSKACQTDPQCRHGILEISHM